MNQPWRGGGTVSISDDVWLAVGPQQRPQTWHRVWSTLSHQQREGRWINDSLRSKRTHYTAKTSCMSHKNFLFFLFFSNYFSYVFPLLIYLLYHYKANCSEDDLTNFAFLQNSNDINVGIN